LVVLGCTLVTAFAFIMIEGRAVADQDRFDDFEAADAPWYSLVGEALYLGFIQLTGAGGYNPGTTLGKLLFAGYSLFVLFAVNSYTANLAASAITTQVAKCNSFEACTAKGHRVCVRSGTASDSVVTRLHGELGEQIVRTTSEWMSLDAGDCEIIAAPKVILDLQKVDGDYNEDCSIERIGVHPINTMDGGWMAKVDYMDRCTSVVNDALLPHMLELQDSGRLAELKAELLASANTRTGATCAGDTGSLSVASGPTDADTSYMYPCNGFVDERGAAGVEEELRIVEQVATSTVRINELLLSLREEGCDLSVPCAFQSLYARRRPGGGGGHWWWWFEAPMHVSGGNPFIVPLPDHYNEMQAGRVPAHEGPAADLWLPVRGAQ